MNDIIEIIKSLDNSSVLIDVVTEIAKHEIKKKQEGRFRWALLTSLAASVVQPVVSSVVNIICEREVRRAGKGNMNTNF